jgi:hypothetical protein
MGSRILGLSRAIEERVLKSRVTLVPRLFLLVFRLTILKNVYIVLNTLNFRHNLITVERIAAATRTS